MGERLQIATAREPDYRTVTNERGESVYVVGVTHCNTEDYNYEDRRCLRYGGYATYRRCKACPNLEFHHEESHRKPDLFWELTCKTGDYLYKPRRLDCRLCNIRIACLSERLKGGGHVRLIKLKRKPKMK